jgi:hypothetical protein
MKVVVIPLLALLLVPVASARAAFEDEVRPVLQKTCLACHNDEKTKGDLNLKLLDRADSITSNRDEWDKILKKLREGEMPPPKIKKPPELPGMIAYLERTFAALDKDIKPDPGRVTARHLNRTEYRNTIRDLLGVDFQTMNEFPVDDSGDGFDNIGDVLSVSPLLAEKYLAAAERISARALGLVKLPDKPLNLSYADDEHYAEAVAATGNNGAAHSAGLSFLEVNHRVDYDGDYVIQAGLAGQRGPAGKPVMMGFWMDNKLLHTEEVPTTRPNTVYFAPYEKREFKVFLPEGVHTFRLGFINDEFPAKLTKRQAYNPNSNKYPTYIGFLGPERPTEPPAGRKKILIRDPNSGPQAIEKMVSTLARRAYRRPVTREEMDKLMKLVSTARAEGLNPEECVQVAIEGMLVSPAFLFHIEQSQKSADAGSVHRISDFELASRLSYFLWSSMPDDQLLDVAESGTLAKPDVLDAQIARMLKDPRASALSENFVGQWLEIRNLDSIKPDPDKFPAWSAEIKDAMRTETVMLFESILHENRPVSEFLTARYTFLNESLARFYGIPGVVGPEFRRVELETSERGGILGLGSVMAVSSYPSRTSVVLRGRFILDNVLGSPPPPPPPDVPSLNEDSLGIKLTLRQQMEKHRADPTCAGCHAKMDPLGFALENYDAIGRWRTKDGQFPVDTSGVLPDGTTFDGPASLREALAPKTSQLAQCIVEKMLVYSLGRGVDKSDRRNVADIMDALKGKEYRLESLIYIVAHSLPFQSRHDQSVQDGGAASVPSKGKPTGKSPSGKGPQ